MDNLDAFTNSSIIIMKKTPNKIVSWITILFISLLFILVFMCFGKYNQYLKYDCYVKDGYLEFFVDEKFFNKMNNNEVLINDKYYNYDIVSIMEFSYDYGINELWKVNIKVKLDNNMLIENNHFQLKFLENEGTIIKLIIKKMKEGFN